MKKTQLHSIQQAYFELQNNYPSDDFIISYKDFLKHRKSLHLYKYNPNVFDAIIKIASDLWFTNNRFSRNSLMVVAAKYLLNKPRKTKISKITSSYIFKIYKSVFLDNSAILTTGNRDRILLPVYRLMKASYLTNDEASLLLKNLNISWIQNTVFAIQYPNPVISQWARDYYEDNEFRGRRAELTSWLIDEDPTFIIDKAIFRQDFEYLNDCDKKAYAKYREELTAYFSFIKLKPELDCRPRESESGHPIDYNDDRIYRDLGITEDSILEYIGIDIELGVVIPHDIEFPRVEAKWRFYGSGITLDHSDPFYAISKLNVEHLTNEFNTNFDVLYSQSMAWSVFYSRLSDNEKLKQLKKHFVPDAYYSYIKIAKRMESPDILEWIIKKNN